MKQAIQLKRPPMESLLHGLGVLLFFSGLYSLFFLPELVGGHFLAPNDAFLQSLPPFFSPRQLWTPLLWGGFPLAADVTPQTWYPISLLFAALRSWNGFVLSAYILASSFTYGYVYSLTRSSFAACFSGIVYGMSGFMMAHLGHTSMIHSAAWIPLMVWSFEELWLGGRYRWIVAGAIAISCCFLGGHPQIFVYGMGLSLLFVLFRGASLSRLDFSFFLKSSTVFLFGILLAGIQLIPLLELSVLTPRAELSFESFLQYSLPISHLPLLLFPYLFGSYGGGPYAEPYWGQWNLTELTGYVGILPLALVFVGWRYISARATSSPQMVRFFWAGAAIISLLLMLGNSTPLASLTYHLPGFNKFRALARYGILFSLSISILSGIALASLQRQRFPFHSLKHFLSRWMLVSAIGIAMACGGLQQNFSTPLESDATLVERLNLAELAIPLFVGSIGLLGLFGFLRRPASAVTMLLLMALLISDLGSFGWFYNKAQYPDKSLASAPDFVERYQQKLFPQHQRIVQPLGTGSPFDKDFGVQVRPNTSMLWALPNLSGYSPLLLERISKLLSMPAHGALPSTWHEELANQSLDVAAVKYAFLPAQSRSLVKRGLRWSQADLGLSLGSDCAPSTVQRFDFELEPSHRLSSGVSATEIAVVSALGCSVGVKQSDALVEISVLNQDGLGQKQWLKAGRDTAEWAYDCPDVKPQMQHNRATIFETFDVEREGLTQTCPNHTYIARIPLLTTPIEQVHHVRLRWQGTAGAIMLHKLSLVDQTTGQSYPLRRRLEDNQRWKYVETVQGNRIYENQKALPRVWLVPTVEVALPGEILTAIQTSRLPDDRLFNPRQVALLEAPPSEPWARALLLGQNALPASAPRTLPPPQLEELSATRLRIETEADSPSFLVLADADYPGWQATMDGQPTVIAQTNYAFRGLPVPPGRHIIEFKFRPRSFTIGLGLTSFAALLLGGVSALNASRW